MNQQGLAFWNRRELNFWCPFFILFKIFHLFIFGCTRSLLLHSGFLWLRRAGAALYRSAQASVLAAHGLGIWGTGLVALQHVGLSRPGIEPMYPALANGSLYTVPPGNLTLWRFLFLDLEPYSGYLVPHVLLPVFCFNIAEKTQTFCGLRYSSLS